MLSGTSFVTTAPAPIVTLLPIVISPIIEEFAPKVQLFPHFGCLLPFGLPAFGEYAAPKTTPGKIVQLSPISDVLPITIPTK